LVYFYGVNGLFEQNNSRGGAKNSQGGAKKFFALRTKSCPPLAKILCTRLNTGIQGFRIQGYRYTGIQGYRDTGIQGYRDTRIQ